MMSLSQKVDHEPVGLIADFVVLDNCPACCD